MAKVYIPRTLRLFTNGDFEIILGGEKISDVVSNLVGKYQDLENYIFTVKFQIMFPLVSHLCFHFFKQVSRV